MLFLLTAMADFQYTPKNMFHVGEKTQQKTQNIFGVILYSSVNGFTEHI